MPANKSMQVESGIKWCDVVWWCETQNDGASQMDSTGGDSAYVMIFYIKTEKCEMHKKHESVFFKTVLCSLSVCV